MAASAFWVSTSGGIAGLPASQQGNLICGNYVKQINVNPSARLRAGYLDIDQAYMRTHEKDVPKGHKCKIGAIMVPQGRKMQRLRMWRSNYNKFICNKAIATSCNGIAALSEELARPDLTDIWRGNVLDGAWNVVHKPSKK